MQLFNTRRCSVSGALGAWQTTNALSAYVRGNACTSSSGYIYCIGGNTGVLSSTVQYAQVLGNGALGAWQTTTSLPNGMAYGSCTASNGYIYCPGGDINNSATSLVQYSQILGAGALGPWSTTNALTITLVDNSCTSYNGYIYCPGGLASGAVSTTVQYSLIIPSTSSGTPFETLPVPSNAMTLTISAVNSTTVNMIYSGNTYTETALPTIYGTWTITGNVIDSSGDSVLISNTLTINPA